MSTGRPVSGADGGWDPAAGSGVVAAMTAAARAVATADGLMADPYAGPFVRTVGIEFLTRIVDEDLDLSRLGGDGGFPRVAEFFAARGRFFDAFFAAVGEAGIRQVVLLGSGLDTRPYRLWWPAGTVLYEIDRPQAVEFKSETMRAWGIDPTVNRRAISADLRADWPIALRRMGFDVAARTAWAAEGLFVGLLPPAAQNRLLDDITGLSAPGSRLAADQLTPLTRPQEANLHQLAERWRRRGLEIDLAALTYPGVRDDVGDHLAARGWAVTRHDIGELFATAGFTQLSASERAGAPAAARYLDCTRRPRPSTAPERDMSHQKGRRPAGSQRFTAFTPGASSLLR